MFMLNKFEYVQISEGQGHDQGCTLRSKGGEGGPCMMCSNASATLGRPEQNDKQTHVKTLSSRGNKNKINHISEILEYI